LIQNEGAIEVLGDGTQTRSFLYIDECIEGSIRLMRSEFSGPVNIGSDFMVSISQLVDIVAEIAKKNIKKNFIPGPTGVQGRNSDNNLIKQKLKWEPKMPLYDGLVKTYHWIHSQIHSAG
jgi:nucleoside-diphosphate-sugar epimerase